jgi:hypothetical protein
LLRNIHHIEVRCGLVKEHQLGLANERLCYRLSSGHLRSLKKSKDATIAGLASELDKIARSRRNRLQLDEQILCRMLGIETRHHLCYVRYYVRSGRVSAHWKAHTRLQKDVELWCRKAPPSDARKHRRLDRFLLGQEKEEPQDEAP